MKTYKFIIIALLLLSYTAKAGKNEVYVVCAYDYKQALASDGRTELPKDAKNIPYFLKISTVDTSYQIEPLTSGLSGNEGVFNNGKNTLIYVHGYGSDFKGLIQEANNIIRLYDVNVILFIWPANDARANPLKNYRESKKNAAKLEDVFMNALQVIYQNNFNRNKHISILFHSLGNVYAEMCAEKISSLKNKGIMFDNIILNAPCVPAKKHDRWVNALDSISKEGVYVIYNNNDRILKSVRLFLEVKRILGQTPLTPLAGKANYIDFTSALKDEKQYSASHSYFIRKAPYDSPKIRNFYYTVLNGNSLNLEDTSLFTAELNSTSRSICY